MKNVFPTLIFILAFSSLKGQYFNRVDTIRVIENGSQIRNPWAGGINFPAVNDIDVNGDGRNDIFIYDKFNARNTVYLNNGNTVFSQAWDYAPELANKFPPINQWVLSYDYNCDGKSDLFTLSSSGPAIAVYRNDFTTGTGLQWTLVDDYLDEEYQSMRQNIFTNGVSLPGLSDIDGDGDMDIIGYNSIADARFIFHKNYSMEDYGICDSLTFKYETGCWGNFALLVGGSNRVTCFHCPCRERGPSGETKESMYDQSIAAPADDTVSGMLLIDIDGDNDKDILIGDVASANSLLVVNDGSNVSAEMGSQDTIFPSYDVPADFDGFHYHSYIDVNNDGIRDLLVYPNFNENYNCMWYYRNDGTDASPVFEFTTKNFLQDNMIEVGENATPVLYDYDNDGLLDLMVGYDEFDYQLSMRHTGIRYYKNTGTSTSPQFELIDNDIANIRQFNFTSPLFPAFADLDGDGDKDMLVGNETGELAYFVNNGGAGNVSDFSFVVFPYMGIDVGKSSTPQLYDVTNDGLSDLVIGAGDGTINFYKNIGTSSSAQFSSNPDNGTMGCIVIHAPSTVDGFTVPYMYDSLGTKRLLVASSNGLVQLYDSIDGNINGCYHLRTNVNAPSESNRVRFNITVSGGDLNGDGLIDIVIGQSTGGVEVRYQSNSGIGITEPTYVKPSLLIGPNPVNDRMHVRFFNLGSHKGNRIKLYDITGKLLLEKEIISNEADLDVSQFSEGIYLAQLISGNSSVSGKFVVKH